MFYFVHDHPYWFLACAGVFLALDIWFLCWLDKKTDWKNRPKDADWKNRYGKNPRQ